MIHIFIMQELGKFNLKINVIPNRREKHVGCSINNRSGFIHSFQFLSCSLCSLYKSLIKKLWIMSKSLFEFTLSWDAISNMTWWNSKLFQILT